MGVWNCKSPLEQLLESFANLEWKAADATLDLSSEKGSRASKKLLADLSAATRTLQVRAASREYRRKFTRNYKQVLGGEAHSYHLDVLKAAMEWTDIMLVNGQEYKFFTSTRDAAMNLSSQWLELMDVLRGAADESCSRSTSALRNCLEQFDAAWASFEAEDISQLIRIEQSAREPLQQARQQESTLQALEASACECRGGHSPCLDLLSQDADTHGFRAAYNKLIRQVGRINAMTNSNGTRGGDLGMEVFIAITRELDPNGSPKGCAHREFAESIAWRAYHSWEQVRSYLKTELTKLEYLDPQLENNKALVKVLVAWERSWTSARLLLDQKMCEGMCLLLKDLRECAFPHLQRMAKECDVELVMAMPRLVLLHYLFEPSLREMMVVTIWPELLDSSDCKVLCEQLPTLESLLRKTIRHPEVDCKQGLWKLLTKAALGEEMDENSHSCGELHIAVKEFLRVLEQWSWKLQRKNPKDWNNCCQAIFDHLAGASA